MRRPQSRLVVAALIALAVVVAYLGVYFLAPRVDGWVNMYLVQPGLWLAAGGAALWLGWDRLPLLVEDREVVLIAGLLGVLQVGVTVLVALFLGFGESPYTHTPLAIVLHLWFVFSVLIAGELARWAFANLLAPRFGELPAVLACTFLFGLTALPLLSYTRLTQASTGFEWAGRLLLPTLAASLLASFLTLRSGPLAAVAYLGVLAAFEWLSPILPNPSWQFAALVGVLTPVFGLALLEREAVEETEAEAEQRGSERTLLIAGVFALLVIWFNFGVFGVRPAAVHGHSMEPSMYTGDLAITKDIDPREIVIGDVIRFQQGSRVVLHRVIEITEVDGQLTFITKGDNNDGLDSPVPADAVQGELVMHIPKAAWPGIAAQRLLGALLGGV